MPQINLMELPYRAVAGFVLQWDVGSHQGERVMRLTLTLSDANESFQSTHAVSLPNCVLETGLERRQQFGGMNTESRVTRREVCPPERRLVISLENWWDKPRNAACHPPSSWWTLAELSHSHNLGSTSIIKCRLL